MKNGKYQDWRREAKIKMCIYRDDQVWQVYYSFHREDVKFTTHQIISIMFARLKSRIQLKRGDRIVFFNNHDNFPHQVIAIHAIS